MPSAARISRGDCRRLAFGPRPGDLAAFDALGIDDDERLAVWVADQLAPGPDSADPWA